MGLFVVTLTASAAAPAAPESRYPDVVQESDAEDAIKVFIVPLRGQVGTDIATDLYESIIEDIKAADPDMVIVHIDSHDGKNVDDEIVDIMEETGEPDQGNQSYPALKPMAELRKLFAEELPADIEQICYVEDAMSVASLLALSFEDMYIDPDAELGGAAVVWLWMAAPVVKDSQKYGKYLRAIMGDVFGIVQYGGWDAPERANMIHSLVAPERVASTTWKGRDSVWYRDLRGDFPVDSTRAFDPRTGPEGIFQATINLSGREAEQLLIAKGVADSDRFVKDILAQRGHRRFKIVGGDSVSKVEKHRASWRAAADRARENWMVFQRMSIGNFMYQLQAAMKALTSYTSAIKTNEAVRIRMQLERLPTNLIQLEMMRDDLKERIRNFNGGGGRGGPGGGGGGGGGFGG